MKKDKVYRQIIIILSAFILITRYSISLNEICHAKSAVSRKIYISQSKLVLLKGERKVLKLVNIKKNIRWDSSNTSVATVNKKGVVTAVSGGTAIITGTLGKKKYTSFVTVETPTISTNRLFLVLDECIQLRIIGSSRKVVWKTNNINIANVSSSGQVIAISSGTATITATIGTLSLTCDVTVEHPAINISKNTIRTGDFFQLEITGTKNPVQWQSIDPTIAIVSTDGLVVGASNGTATIIGTAGSYTFACIVSVESYALNRTSMLLNIGQDFLLQIIGSTEPITWLSSDSKIASVDNSGFVRAIASGKVNISGIIGSKTYICTITVDGLTLNHTSAQIYVDDSIQLVVNDTTLPVQWQSSNEDVADVEDGLVYAYSEGTTEISAIIGNRKLCCTITVLP